MRRLSYVLAICALGGFCSPVVAQRICPPQRPTVVVNRDVTTLVWTDCSSGRQETFSFPNSVRVLPRHVPLFKAGYAGPFEKEVEKVDTVWVDDVIDISQPLRSYGGDIILYANEIHINAPIDSRFYIFHDVNHFAPGAERHVNGFQAGETFNAYTWTTFDGMEVLFGGSWKDYYERCFDCPGDGRIPELPSGLVGNVVERITGDIPTPLPGNPPPDDSIIFDNAHAGNIYIFAKEIHINDSLKHPFIPEDRAECKGTSTAVVPFAISAAGAKGGRGGAGAADTVGKIIPNRQFNTRADWLSRLGKLNTAGGRGGDAGNVYIRIVSDDPGVVKGYVEELTPLVSVAGGEPGSRAELNTPSSLGPHIADGTRCSFVEAGEWPAAQKGNDGTKAIELIDSTTALQFLAALLSSKDSQTGYDFSVVLEETNLDTEQYSTTAS